MRLPAATTADLHIEKAYIASLVDLHESSTFFTSSGSFDAGFSM
jgi:hypothetical protein